MKRRHLGEAKLETTFFTHCIATFASGVFVADIPSRGTHFTTLEMNTFVFSLKYLCTLLYPNSSKEDFCKTSLSSAWLPFQHPNDDFCQFSAGL